MGRHRSTSSTFSTADRGANCICVLILHHAIYGQAVLAILLQDTIQEDAIQYHYLTRCARICHHRLVGLTGALRRYNHRAHSHLHRCKEEQLHGCSVVADNNSIVSLVDELVDERQIYIKEIFRRC